MPGKKDEHYKEIESWAKDLIQRGFYPKPETMRKMVAVRNAYSIIGEDEKSDPQAVLENIEHIIARWATATNATPTSIQPAESRARTLLDDYVTYLQDPQKLSKKRGKTSIKKPKPKEKPTLRETKPEVHKPDVPFPIEGSKEAYVPTIHIDLQIHIAPETNTELIDQIFNSIGRYLYWK